MPVRPVEPVKLAKPTKQAKPVKHYSGEAVESVGLVYLFVGRPFHDESVLAIMVIAIYSCLDAKIKRQVELLGTYVTYPDFKAKGFSAAVINGLLY